MFSCCTRLRIKEIQNMKRFTSKRTESETSEDIELEHIPGRCYLSPCQNNRQEINNSDDETHKLVRNYGLVEPTNLIFDQEVFESCARISGTVKCSTIVKLTYSTNNGKKRCSIKEVPSNYELDDENSEELGELSESETSSSTGDNTSECSECCRLENSPIENSQESLLDDQHRLLANCENIQEINDEYGLSEFRRHKGVARRIFNNIFRARSFSSVKTIIIERPPRLARPCITMISYVRSEASGYAERLKNALEELKISTYLDSSGLLPGFDWQNSLNKAIEQCVAFVPLITPSYGETRWTAREFKLADHLSKFIIPINFCKIWPPPSLAIQLATIQYIDWIPRKFPDPRLNFSEYKFHKIVDFDEHSSKQVTNVSYWPEQYINETANKIKLSMLEKFQLTEQDFVENLRKLTSRDHQMTIENTYVVNNINPERDKENEHLLTHSSEAIVSNDNSTNSLIDSEEFETLLSHDDNSLEQFRYPKIDDESTKKQANKKGAKRKLKNAVKILKGVRIHWRRLSEIKTDQFNA